jgi:transcriptional regulator GlxA family with amidase domain
VPARQRYQRIVDRFEEVARADLETLKPISEMCEAVGVSQHTLARAFRVVHGTTPLRHLHALRLAEARKALLSTDAASENVTQIAMRFGFRELGRFAVAYRTAFGESPSETRRRNGTRSREVGDRSG